MRWRGRMRFSLATIMMLVVTAAAASALFAKVRQFTPAAKPYLKVDLPILFVISIPLTAIALGSLKKHTVVQIMLQTTLACLGFLSLIGLTEVGLQRPLLYWFQISFGLLVTLPLTARRFVKTELDRGPRRDWWMRTYEAILFSFMTMMLVLLGVLLQFILNMLMPNILKL